MLHKQVEIDVQLVVDKEHVIVDKHNCLITRNVCVNNLGDYGMFCSSVHFENIVYHI